MVFPVVYFHPLEHVNHRLLSCLVLSGGPNAVGLNRSRLVLRHSYPSTLSSRWRRFENIYAQRNNQCDIDYDDNVFASDRILHRKTIPFRFVLEILFRRFSDFNLLHGNGFSALPIQKADLHQ